MSRLIGYMCSDDSLTPYAMDEVRRQAWAQPSRLATLGFGWVQDSRTLLRKHPSTGGEPVDVLGLLADVPARSIVGYLHPEADEHVDSLDLEPFRFRKWVFAQTGHIPQFGAFRDDVMAELPDHLRRNIQGQTDAEVVFHVFYRHMKRLGALRGRRADGRLAARALAATLDELDQRCRQAGHEGGIDVNIVAATERLVVVSRLGEPIHCRLFSGVEQPGEDPLFAGHRPSSIDHPHFRGVFLASGLQPDNHRWVEVADRHVGWIDESWKFQSWSIEALIDQD